MAHTTPVLSSSSPPRPVSVSAPSTSRSPPAKTPSASRMSNNQSTPILPSYPSLPPSHDPVVSNSRARRRLQVRRSNPLPATEQPTNSQFVSNVCQNDTLQRLRRDQQLHQHLKQQQQQRPPSSSDEHDSSPPRDTAQPSPRCQSYDSNQVSNPSARQRRRDFRSQLSSSHEYITTTGSNEALPHSPSQETLLGEKDVNEFVMMLTATLQLPRASDTTEPLFETSRLQERCRLLREYVMSTEHEGETLFLSLSRVCLRDIPAEKLRTVLRILENVSGTQLRVNLFIPFVFSSQTFVLLAGDDARTR